MKLILFIIVSICSTVGHAAKDDECRRLLKFQNIRFYIDHMNHAEKEIFWARVWPGANGAEEDIYALAERLDMDVTDVWVIEYFLRTKLKIHLK